ncbi:MAG TPA: CsgG/HfaB family protein [bacterium]|nr:CsgG/HfaB family protein [bacterium]
MRRMNAFLVGVTTLALIMALAGGVLGQGAQMKKRVAVFTFEDKTNHQYHWWSGQPVGEGMADMLITELVKSGRYQVLERTEIQKVMDEQALGQSGAVTQESAAKVGQLLGVELAVVGAVTEFGWAEGNMGGSLAKKGLGLGVKTTSATVAVDVRLVNTSTGEILAADNVRKTESKKGLSLNTNAFDFDNRDKFDESIVGKATRQAIDEIVQKIDVNMANVKWQAKIIKADAQVFINAGAASGIENGQQLVVFRAGEELVDPDTGISLGSEETQVGVIEVVNNTVGNGKAAICKIISGSGFQRNDIVRMK